VWPAYPAFSRLESWGDPAAVRGALDELWSRLEDEELSTEGIDALVERCTAEAPDLDDFNTPIASAALNAAAAVVAALETAARDDPEEAVTAASLVVETLDQYVFLVSGGDEPPEEDAVARHPLMRGELESQRRDLAWLRGGEDLDATAIGELRRDAQEAALVEVARELAEISEERRKNRTR
jgi:uncharacterized protein